MTATQPKRPRYVAVEPSLDDLRAAAREYGALKAPAQPQMEAFAAGRDYSLEKLHMECVFALGVTLADRPGGASPAGESYVDWERRVRDLETWARRALRRDEYRYRLEAAVAGLAEFGVPIEDILPRVEAAYARGARHRP